MDPQGVFAHAVIRWIVELGQDLLHVVGMRTHAGTRHRRRRLRHTLEHLSDLAAEFTWRPPSTSARGVRVPQRNPYGR